MQRLLTGVMVLLAVFSMNACTKKAPSEPAPLPTRTDTPFVTATITRTHTVTPTVTNTPRIDIYEPDNTAGEAKPVTVNSAAQPHNFYAVNDTDFITFSGLAGYNYLVRAVDTNGTTITISLQDANNGADNNSWSDGHLWAFLPIFCLTDTTYTIQVLNYSNIYGEDVEYDLDVIQLPVPTPVNFNTAVDEAVLTYTFSGDASWFGQSDVSHTGGSAAQSPHIYNGQNAAFSADVTGPCTVKFWWKVSSESCCDTLNFTVDGGSTANLSTAGQLDWVQQVVVISTAGAHTLEWEYRKDSTIACGYDTAWVDSIEVIP